MAARFVAPFILAALTGIGKAADHPCEAEVQSACPDRPGAEILACLKDPAEHDNPTTVSSECTDFIALNKACAEEIVQFCDEAFFSHDTALCLSEWTDKESLGQKCAGVVAWAVPKREDSVGPTDELGLSEADYEEKRKWQAERREKRGAAVEKLRSEQDSLKARQRLDGEDEQAYKQRMTELDELERSQQELKKRERLLTAAKEREWRREQGLPEIEEGEQTSKKERRRSTIPQNRRDESDNRLTYVLGGLFVAYVFFNVVNFFSGKQKKEE